MTDILKEKSDLTLIEINVLCEVPFYFINKFKWFKENVKKLLF